MQVRDRLSLDQAPAADDVVGNRKRHPINREAKLAKRVRNAAAMFTEVGDDLHPMRLHEGCRHTETDVENIGMTSHFA